MPTLTHKRAEQRNRFVFWRSDRARVKWWSAPGVPLKCQSCADGVLCSDWASADELNWITWCLRALTSLSPHWTPLADEGHKQLVLWDEVTIVYTIIFSWMSEKNKSESLREWADTLSPDTTLALAVLLFGQPMAYILRSMQFFVHSDPHILNAVLALNHIRSELSVLWQPNESE